MMSSNVDPAPLVLHLVFSLGTGGLENGLVNLINRSSPNEFRHMVVCLTSSGSFSRRITRKNVEIVELEKPEGHSLLTLKRLRALIKQYRPSVLHSRNLAALEFQLAGLGISGINRVHGEHGRDINDPEGRNWKHNLLRKASRLWIDRYIAVSRELELWLSDRIGVDARKITRQSNGVDCEIFSPRSPQQESVLRGLESALDIEGCYVIGTVGRLAAIKDQKTLISAFASVVAKQRGEVSRLCLLIVGDGPMRKELESHADRFGVSGLVRFCGDRDDVSELLKLMDVFVLPSIAEGVSNTLLEAMATGVPVVATAVGGAPDIIVSSENGYLVEVGDVEQIANTLMTCISDQDGAQELGFNGRQTVERYHSWSVAVESYSRIYRELTASQTVGKTMTT